MEYILCGLQGYTACGSMLCCSSCFLFKAPFIILLALGIKQHALQARLACCTTVK